MRKWVEIDMDVIFDGNDEDGNRYRTQFLKDYRDIFQPEEINAGCRRCLKDYYFKLIKFQETMSKDKKKSGYVLKLKYQGIPLKFGSRIFVTNANMTDKIGKELLKNHPRGAMLFDKIPETKPKKDKDLTKKELVAKYPDIHSKLKKKDFLKAVAESQVEGIKEEG